MAKFEDELILKDSASDKLDKIAGKMSGLSAKGEKLKNVFGKITGGLGKVGKGALSVAGSLGKVGLAALGISDVAVGALALSCVQAARDAETLNTTMDLLTGSAEKSKKVFADLDKEVGIFSRDTLRGLSVQMLDNGISTEKLIPTLKMLEGFSMGSAENLQKLTDQLTKVSATGTVTAQSLKALSMIGIDGQKEMQKQLGVTPKLFKKLLSAGRITFSDYERLLQRVYNSTDKYNQSIDKLSNTVNGKFDKMGNKFDVVKQRLTESIGRIALPYLEKVADRMDNWADKLNDLPLEKVEKLNEVLNATIKLFKGILWVIEKIGALLKGLFNIAKGFVGVITGLATDFKSFSKAMSSMSWGDIGKGMWNGDLLDKITEIQRKQREEDNKIPHYEVVVDMNKKSALQSDNDNKPSNIYNNNANTQYNTNNSNKTQQTSPNNTWNMSNVFNINGTVREEADVNKIAETIANRVSLKFGNMRNT
jgi:tape measure domain-containing protein